MFKNKTLVYCFSVLMCFGSHAQVADQLKYAPESEIPHAIGVYVTKRGQNKLFNGIPEIVELNGLSISKAYFHHLNYEMEEKTLEELLPKEGAFRDAALKVRESLSRFLMGLDFAPHKFGIDGGGLDLDIGWKEVAIRIDDNAKRAGILKLKLVLETESLAIGVETVRAYDKGNDFLGQVGLDDVLVHFDESSAPLRIEVPLTLINQSGALGPRLEIGAIETNIDEVLLAAEIRGAVTLPVIEIHINGRVIKANYAEIENMLRESQDRISQSIKKSMQSYLTDDAAAMLNEKIADKTNEGLFKEVNVMSPAGAPLDQLVDPFEWGMKLKNYDFLGDSLHLSMDGYFKDPKKGPYAFNSAMQASRVPRLSQIPRDHDFVFSVNEGFINRIVQLSYRRGYFNSFETEDGENYIISKMPQFKLKEASDSKAPRLSVELEYTVTGVGAALVNNPIHINFDMLLDFPVEQGKIKIIATEIDMESVHVDKKYIKNFLGIMSWSGVVMPQVRKRFRSAQNDVRGMVLSDEFPIPESMMGLPLKVMDTAYDAGGHLMIHIDTELTGAQ